MNSDPFQSPFYHSLSHPLGCSAHCSSCVQLGETFTYVTDYLKRIFSTASPIEIEDFSDYPYLGTI
jgi:hypothetical protein